jgi:hypothetical protein
MKLSKNPFEFKLPQINDIRGNLSFLENNMQLPFKIKRIYWIYDVPGGQSRGGHAYKKLEEVIIALSGSFDLDCHSFNGEKRAFTLNRSYKAVYIPGNTWRELKSFSTNSVALVIASQPYDANDYIYDFEEFKIFNN